MPSTSEMGSFWFAALAEPLGIYLRTSNPMRLKSSLYAVRTRLNDPRLARLQLRTSPLNPTGELWIVNPGEDEAAGEGEEAS